MTRSLFARLFLVLVAVSLCSGQEPNAPMPQEGVSAQSTSAIDHKDIVKDPQATTIAQAAFSDPQALALAQQAELALTGGMQVSDITLNATAVWIIGSTHETGTAVLTGKGVAESRLDVSAGTAIESEIRNSGQGRPAGQWLDARGARHPMALHNCWTPATSFFPQFVISLLTQPKMVTRYLGRETRNDLAVDHIQTYQTSAQKEKIAAVIQKLSTVDVFLDANTHLPVAIRFNNHPDKDYSRDIPIEIRFADYRNAGGLLVPHRIQRFIQSSLNLDLSVTDIAVNIGITDGTFSLQ